MKEIQFVCPHCGTLQGGRYASIVPYETSRVSCFVLCNKCDRGSVIYGQSASIDKGYVGRNVMGMSHVTAKLDNISRERIAPDPPKPRSVHSLPDNVERAYTDGEQHMATRHWRSAVASYRTALERSIRALDADSVAAKGPLYQRIEKFAQGYAIPNTLLDLMHSVRDFGNDIHEDSEPTEAEAKMAADCANLLLIYLFELPARVEAAKARKEKAEPGT